MRGMLADVNIQGHLPYIRRLLEQLGLWEILAGIPLAFVTFADLGLDRGVDDRTLWNHCQRNLWVLLTDNRNHEDENSLEATLADSWHVGHLPVLTLANIGRFENSRSYAEQVAAEIAEILYGVALEEYRDQPRIYVPR